MALNTVAATSIDFTIDSLERGTEGLIDPARYPDLNPLDISTRPQMPVRMCHKAKILKIKSVNINVGFFI